MARDRRPAQAPGPVAGVAGPAGTAAGLTAGSRAATDWHLIDGGEQIG